MTESSVDRDLGSTSGHRIPGFGDRVQRGHRHTRYRQDLKNTIM